MDNTPDLDDHTGYFTAKEGQWLRDLESNGWSDLWRQRNPDQREYTWHHHNGAGFRIDQLFATRAILENVQELRYDWGSPSVGKMRGPSDHAAIVFDFDAEASPSVGP
jgi:exonuclease III